MLREVLLFFAFASAVFGTPVPDAFLNRNGRIVGGSDSPLGRQPWMAMTYVGGEPRCGATIIANRWVVSALHCFSYPNPAETQVRVGTVLLDGHSGTFYPVSMIINHPGGMPNDINVIQTAIPMVFTANVRSIQMGSNYIPGGVMATAIGWGQLWHGGPSPTHLQEVEIRTITNNFCHQPPQILCTHWLAGRGICFGDSGGPLISGGFLIGVTSFTIGSCADGNPDGFARMSDFREWIMIQMRNNP